MRTTTIASAAFVPVSIVAITIATAASVVAANPSEGGFDTREQLYDAGGAVVAGWTVSALKPSGDTIPYPVAGQLYETTATVEADQGSVTPIISNFNARATDGETYRALDNAATPQGVNPSPLAQGAKSTGKIYFDVTGATPNSVVYNDGSQDLLIWTGAPNVAAPPPAAAPPGAAAPPQGAAAPALAAPAPAPAAPPAPAPAPAAAAPAAPAAPAPTPAAPPTAAASMPSGTSPSGGTSTGVSGMNPGGSVGTGGNPAAGTSTGVSGTNFGGSAGPGGSPAGKT